MSNKPYKGSEPYIFISYAHKNMAAAMEIIGFLQSNGYRVWFDEGIDPGTEWDMTIATHINNCGCFVALISPEYIASDNCCDELNYARDKKRDSRLLIYLSETTLPDGMAMRLNRIQAIFKYKYANQADFYEKIMETSVLHHCRGSETSDSVQISPVPDAAWKRYPEFFDDGLFAPSPDPDTTFFFPDNISNRFMMGEAIGMGGYGRVYKGIDTLTGSSVVIQKYIDDGYSYNEIGILFDQKLRDRVLTFDHPGMCKCIAIETSRALGYSIIVKEFIEGTTLSEKELYYTAAPLPVKLRLLNQIASALDYLHSMGICYGDLNPDNIMIRSNGNSCLMDYSDVNFEGAHYPLRTIILNPVSFMAPERIENKPYDRRTDIYAFGKLINWLKLHCNLPASVHGSLSFLLWQMTQENPGKRPDSIADVIKQINSIAN